MGNTTDGSKAAPHPKKMFSSAVAGVTAACGACNTCDSHHGKRASRMLETKVKQYSEVTAVATAVCADAAAIVAAFDDGQVNIWVCQMGTPFTCCSCYGQTGDISCISIYEDSLHTISEGIPLTICLGTREGHVTLLELDFMCGIIVPTQRWLAHAPSPGFGQTYAGTSAVALDGSTLVSGGADSTVGLWKDACGKNLNRSKERLRRIDGAHGGAVAAVCHSTIGSANDFTMTAGEDGIVKAWSPSEDCELPRHDKDRDSSAPKIRSTGATTGSATSLVLDDALFRCCAGFQDNFARLWDLAAGRATLRFGHIPQRQRADAVGMEREGVLAVAFDGLKANVSMITSGSADGSICIWDVRERFNTRPSMHLQAFARDVASVAVHGDVILAASLAGNASLWDLRRGASEPMQNFHLLGGTSMQPPQSSHAMQNPLSSEGDSADGQPDQHMKASPKAALLVEALATQNKASMGKKIRKASNLVRMPSGDEAAVFDNAPNVTPMR